jgi:hypothetical protein
MTCKCIQIEGGDQQGKSHLAAYLAEKHNALVLHQGYRFRQQIFTYHTAILLKAEEAMRAGRLVVLDRLWLSEAIYARVYRGGTPWPHQGRLFDRVLTKLGATTVFCLASGEAMPLDRPELYPDKVKAGLVKDEYACVFEGQEGLDSLVLHPEYACYHDDIASAGGWQRRTDGVRYDWHQHDTTAKLAAFAGKLLTLPGPKPQWEDPRVIGNTLNPRVIFVGDRLNAKSRKIRWPFFEYGNCSLYLAQACHAAKLDETKAAWLNANDPGSADVFKTLRARCPGVSLVALGAAAEDTLLAWGHTPDTVAPHPQWGRRFDSAGLQYFPLLRAAVHRAGAQLQ